ncbi:MAG: choice-of-anchor C family protein [Phycisphaerales bacterium]
MLNSARIFALAAALPAIAGASIIQNGSFEATSIEGEFAYAELNAGSDVISGWTVTGTGVDVIGTHWAASQGSNSLDMNGLLAGGGVSQTFETIVGQEYALTFDMSANMFLGPNEKVLGVSVAGHLEEHSFDYMGFEATASDPKWTQVTINFTADETSTTLSFFGVNSGAAGAALDNVAVNPVPAPGALAGLGLAGLFGARRRR